MANSISALYYSTYGDNLVIRTSAYPGVGSYTVTIEADIYDDAVFNLRVNSISVPDGVKVDNADSIALGDDVVVNVIAFSSYKSAIDKVYVGGVELDSAKYSIDYYGKLTIDKSVFESSKDYDLKIEATNFEDFTQTIAVTIP